MSLTNSWKNVCKTKIRACAVSLSTLQGPQATLRCVIKHRTNIISISTTGCDDISRQYYIWISGKKLFITLHLSVKLFFSLSKAIIAQMPFIGNGTEEERILSYLPLTHVAGFMVDVIMPLYVTATRAQSLAVSFARIYDLKVRIIHIFIKWLQWPWFLWRLVAWKTVLWLLNQPFSWEFLVFGRRLPRKWKQSEPKSLAWKRSCRPGPKSSPKNYID